METRVVDVIELKKIMVERGIDKITTLSNSSGIARTTLSHLLNRRAKPSASVIERLIAALNISPSKAGEIFSQLTCIIYKSVRIFENDIGTIRTQ